MSRPTVTLPDERREAFRQAWTAPEITLATIQFEFAISQKTAQRIAREMGLGHKASASGVKWTAEQDAMLRKLHADPDVLSYGVIADRLNRACGTRYSRGAISGRVDRLGLTPRMVAVSQAFRARLGVSKKSGNPHMMRRPQQPPGTFVLPPVNRTHEPEPPRAVTKERAFDPLSGVEPVPFLEREGARCRWPLELDREGYWCCGAPTSDVTVNYCAAHDQLSINQSDWAKRHKAQMSPRGLRKWAA